MAGRFSNLTLAKRLAASATIFNSMIAASLNPSISFSRSGLAATTSTKDPKRASSALASGLTSRLGMARKRTSSSNS